MVVGVNLGDKIVDYLRATGNTIDSYDLANVLTEMREDVGERDAKKLMEGLRVQGIMEYDSNQDSEIYSQDVFMRSYRIKRNIPFSRLL